MDFDVSKVNIDFEALKASTEKLLQMPYSARQFHAVVEKAMEQAKLDKAAEKQRIAEDAAIELTEEISEQEAPETDAELQEMNGDLLKLNEEFVAEIEKLTAQVENYRSEAEKAQSTLAKERTDWHRQKKSYEGELWRLQKDNDELRALLESCDEQGEAEQETYEEGEAALPTVLPSLPESRIVFVGGHPNMVNKVKAIYPNWVYVDGDHSPEKATQFDKVIACFIAYKHIGHPLWASMMAAARSYDVPIFYVQYTNMERMLLDMRRSYAAIAQFRADEGIDDSDVTPTSPEETQEDEKTIWEKQEEARRAAKEKSKKQRERKKAREQRETSEAQLEIEARAEEAAREERKRWAEERQKRAEELRKRQAEARERERLWKEEQARKAAELKLKREAERLDKLEEEKKRQAEYEERRKAGLPRDVRNVPVPPLLCRLHCRTHPSWFPIPSRNSFPPLLSPTTHLSRRTSRLDLPHRAPASCRLQRLLRPWQRKSPHRLYCRQGNPRGSRWNLVQSDGPTFCESKKSVQ